MYKTLSEITIQSLKEHATLIHYFGLGFIQIKLGETYRIHFYTDKLPAIIGDEDIHNHRYDFTSRILYGTFSQELFALVPGNSHTLEQESCKEGVPSTVLPTKCSIEKILSQTFTAGSSYTISHNVFHTVSANTAITLLERGPIKKEFADVVRPVGFPKVCPFSKKVSEEELWSIVQEILVQAQEEKEKLPL